MKPSRKIRLYSGLVVGLAVAVALLWAASSMYQRGRRDALVEAANGGNLKLVQDLLADGVDPNARGSRINTETALMRAAANGHAEIVRALLDHGADVDARHRGEGMLHGRTALFFAIDNRHDAQTIDLLLERGADVKAKDRQGETLLVVALKRDLPAVALRLLERGADVNVTDLFGRPAIVLAVERVHSPDDVELWNLVRAMLDKGAEVNARDSDRSTIAFSEPGFLGGRIESTLSGTTGGVAGRTPLMFAARTGHRKLVELLLEKGADVNARDQTGKTARQLAEEGMRPEVVELLKKAGAKE